MRLPRFTKPVAALAVIVGLFVYLLLVELGVNAGRVHHGVSVEGYEIGGRTFREAEALLKKHGRELQEAPILFGAEGFDCRYTPGRIGWGPQPHDTATLAMGIGRPLTNPSSIKERIDAYLDGVQVEWADEPDPVHVDELIAECQKHARALGREIDEDLLRVYIERAITIWPRERILPIPFADVAG